MPTLDLGPQVAETEFFDDSGPPDAAPVLVAKVADPTGAIFRSGVIPLSARLFQGKVGPLPKTLAWALLVGGAWLGWRWWKQNHKKRRRR